MESDMINPPIKRETDVISGAFVSLCRHLSEGKLISSPFADGQTSHQSLNIIRSTHTSLYKNLHNSDLLMKITFSPVMQVFTYMVVINFFFNFYSTLGHKVCSF